MEREGEAALYYKQADKNTQTKFKYTYFKTF
jgi:hypothetical protein